MNRVGRVCLGLQITVASIAGILFLASFWGFGGDSEMVAAAVISLLGWGTLCGLAIYAAVLARVVANGNSFELSKTLGWTRGVLLTGGILGMVTAWVCGFLAFATCGVTWLAPLYHWGGLGFAALAFLAWFVLPGWIRGEIGGYPPHTEAPATWQWGWVLGVFCFFAAVWVAAIIVMANYDDKDDYVKRATGGFALPYPEGTTAWLVQGASSLANHSDNLAYDFRLPCGTDILASADGTVLAGSTDDFTGHGGDTKDNKLHISLPGGGYVQYAHIKQGSMGTLEVNDQVYKGQKIAEVGNVGNSLTGHIHWEVYDDKGKPVPSVFEDEDVAYHDGIPRSFWYYTSSNTRRP